MTILDAVLVLGLTFIQPKEYQRYVFFIMLTFVLGTNWLDKQLPEFSRLITATWVLVALSLSWLIRRVVKTHQSNEV